MHQQIASTVFIASLLMQVAPVFAANGADEPERAPAVDDAVENIIVTGQRPGVLRQMMEDFIVEIGVPAARSRGYARWRHRLCVGVYNLPDQAAAQYIADKISVTAFDVGLRTGLPGCNANLKIVFSPDARALASQMVENTPDMFRPFGNTEGTTQGLAALEQFRTSEAAVRWWQITMVVDEIGHVAISLPGFGGTSSVRGTPSRIRGTISDEIWGSLIIVDASQLDNVQWPQLADYLAMVALAQIDPNGRPSGYDSILNLFNTEVPPLGMTDMDRIYLRSLYDMDTMMLPHTQRGVFSNWMVRTLREMEQAE